MAGILTLVHKRTSQKLKLKKIIRDFSEHSKSPLTVFRLRELLNQALEVKVKVETIQDEILSKLTVEDDADLQHSAMEEIDEYIITIRSSINEALSSLTSVTPGTSTSLPRTDQSYSTQVKLPKLDLPEFSGNYEEWPSFRDQFEATIVNNTIVSGCSKLQYLKSKLKDEALKIVAPFTITNANFTDAWTLCIDRYNNTREIVFSLLRKLFKLPKLKEESASNLRNLVDTFDQCIRELRNLERDVDHWDDFLVFTIMDKLDQDTKREWATQLEGTIVPKFVEVKDFLEKHIRGLQSISNSSKSKDGNRKNANAASTSHPCPLCTEQHPLFKCSKFNVMTPSQRLDAVKANRYCVNCLGSGHSPKHCHSKGRCRVCSKTHHTQLHLPTEADGNKNVPNANNASLSSASCNHNSGFGVLLGTAEVKVRDSCGSFQTCRVLLDPGAEVSFCTDRCIKRLGLSLTKTNVTINGVGSTTVGKAKGKTTLFIKSIHNEFTLNVSALVQNQVTGQLPSFTCGDVWKQWTHIHNLQLADPKFMQPRDIDILLGAEVTQRIFTGNTFSSRTDQPLACSSEFGWLIMGTVKSPAVQSYTVTCNTASLNESIQRLWELDSVPNRVHLTKEESEAEHHFETQHSRSDGRYVVPLPFKESISDLGPTRSIALKRLHHTERRLDRFPQYKSEYNKFLSDYLSLGHMEEVSPSDAGERTIDGSIKTNYLPHHFVLKEDSTTTKLRVVFDGSCKSESGSSLNECLMVGPTIQPDVLTHLLKFRLDPIVVKGDITKMYRQFLVPDLDSHFQRILWRQSADQPVKEYRLKTITYGTSSAPFCAIRALYQLAIDEGDKFPLAKSAIKSRFYVDDLLAGASTVSTAIKLREVTKLLQCAKLSITKWTSNSPEVLDGIPSSQVELSPQSLTEDSSTKALGVRWCPSSDSLNYNGFRFDQTSDFTKRKVLQDLSRLFDPLGILSPFVISAKIFFQKLWNINLQWDEELPYELATQWISLGSTLSYLEQISIPRCVIQPKYQRIELHGFSDASEQAYCAAVYIRTVLDGSPKSRLLVSKTNVAPVKAQSLPRLELCGALLLAKLISYLVSSLDLDCQIHCWTDSEITLRWISSLSRRWLPFVANRVAQIQELTPVESWHFIPGLINPADCGTRGIPLSDLVNNELWWRGPKFLSDETLPSFQQSTEVTTFDVQEERKVKVLTANVDFSVLFRYSTYLRLIRVIGCLLRVSLLIQHKPAPAIRSVELYQLAKLKVAQLSQREYFQLDIDYLEKHGHVRQSSSLISLSPFLDSERSLRVGGRLQKSPLPESVKHPLIIHGKSHLTRLLVEHYHHTNHHAGNRLLLSLIRQDYWIVQGRDLIKSVCSRCLRCKLLRHRTISQLMGSLPSSRVTPSSPFHHTGVDYAGTFTLQTVKGRGHKQFKGYFCVFICMSTKAVHLEFGTDLSTDSFIGSLKRFISRRGYPQHIYSDCGSNFKGANHEMVRLVRSDQFNQGVSSSISEYGVYFHFNPPSAPHHGGIWESAVRSVKYHLLRIIGNTTLTLEEFATILCQTEAALNSRPLLPLSDNVEDLGVITPGHFLVGKPLLALPRSDLTDIKLNRLSRWQLQEQLFQTFWKVWSLEYLTSLQQRMKWTKQHNNAKIGDLVAIKEDDFPPLKWKLGRITKVHPGLDGLIRVVTLKTATGELQRPIVKLVPLLSDDNLDPN